MKNLLLASTSTLHGGNYLEYLAAELEALFDGVSEITFIPFARPGGISHDDYTDMVQKAFRKIGLKVRGLHTFENIPEGIRQSEAIFTGGGNTFLLVKQLYDLDLFSILKTRIRNGLPYLGSSAGTNIAGLSMGTTNDMPVVLPGSFQTIGAVPFNINPHYLDPEPHSKHMGETRETRIKEFHYFNPQPVVGLREGSWIRITDQHILLKGDLPARIFQKNQKPIEIEPLSDLNFLK